MTVKPTHTRIHNVRVPDALWAAATARAAERGETVSDVVRRALTRYAKASTPPFRGGPLNHPHAPADGRP